MTSGILVADIGGTKIAAARVDSAGVLASEIRQVPTPAGVVDAVVKLLAELRETGDVAVAIAAAGVVDVAGGKVLTSTSSISGWGGTPLADLVSERLGLPVWVIGDGNAFGIGLSIEYGVPDLLALVAGTGVGGSLILNGEPVLGAHHAGGHFGHVVAAEAAGMPCPCGRIGHLEAVASGYGILAWYHAQGGDPTVATTRDLARRTDELALAALRTGGTALGAAAAGLVNAIDPQLVVVAGSVARAGEVWESALRTAYRDGLIPAVAATRLEVSGGGAETALRGAAHYVTRRMTA
ncbi:glucokinase [Kribbella aluminosa]|uniref:Glucokinase n=1 Tax=Kribbella aluminosa TaxID=416017 RepID=A0ABS4UXY4_9ACTN|nr:ROK family protein [Kribbella aluminosa]MBP2356505.1 glucokinase [Kribbella aluminosa]